MSDGKKIYPFQDLTDQVFGDPFPGIDYDNLTPSDTTLAQRVTKLAKAVEQWSREGFIPGEPKDVKRYLREIFPDGQIFEMRGAQTFELESEINIYPSGGYAVLCQGGWFHTGLYAADEPKKSKR